MFNSPKKLFFIGSLLLLIAILAFFIHRHNLAVYTANLDTRSFNAGVCRPVNSVEPATISEHQERLIAAAIYEGLLCYDAKSGELQPRLARKWKYSSDGKTLTIHLKENIKFHNGKKLTAGEVKSAWEKSFSESKEWSNISLFLSIVGSNAMLDGYKKEISGIQVVNDGTLKIVFDQPNTAFTYMLTSPVFWVYDSSAENSPAPGTGPYLLKEKQEDKDFLLLRNEKYHRGMPRLAAINFRIYDDEITALEDYKSGKLDYLDSIPFNQLKAIKKDPQYKKLYLSRPLLNTYSLVFHVNKQPFVDGYLLRRALNYAIDRKAINDTILGGAYIPARGAVPSGMAGYKSNMSGYSYDPEKARQLLEDAGYIVGDQLIPVLISYDNDDGHRAVMEMVAQQLNQVGISVEFSPMEWDYYKKQLGKMQIACGRVSWYADYPDPDNFLYSMFHSSKIGVSNYSAYHNPQVDKLLDSSRKQVNAEKRLEFLHQAEEIIVDDAPCLWLFQKCAHKLIGENVSSLSVDNMEIIDWYQVELRKPDIDEEKDKVVKGRKKV
ncbi:MAG: ABC transporter substrate-binding protein [Syntrophomonadaceae bacterium]|nr:ABC transporter substrate-binding protein [Syntrophomonadaceae bacterium]MDD4562025.1 ABC transporter substrate-binding protein [Syntrophomonadaceae bacterium]